MKGASRFSASTTSLRGATRFSALRGASRFSALRGASRFSAPWGATLFVALLVVLAGCAGEPTGPSGDEQDVAESQVAPAPRELASPAREGSFGPELTGGGEVILSWLEVDDSGDPHQPRLRWSRLDDQGWGASREISVGGELFANWADRPHIVPLDKKGGLVAHWLEMVGEGSYSYGIALGHSIDGGESWQPAGWLHDDLSPQEHGFASWVVGDRQLWAFWLDGRAMGEGEPMQLRALALDPTSPVGESEGRQGVVLDTRVCECCDTDTVMSSTGPVVAYRDRSEGEVRNISIVRLTTEGWSEPTHVHDDGWTLYGCPVNGPALAANGETLAVAWFTLADDSTPRVRLAWSNDGGASFGQPVRVAGQGTPLGRVDLELGPRGNAWVLWLEENAKGRAEVRLRSISPRGETGEPIVIAETAASRAAGVPRLARRADQLIVAWVEVTTGDDSQRQVRTAWLPLG